VEHLYVAAVAGLALVLAVAASVLISRADNSSPGRKTLQFLFVWLIPVFGPMVAIAILRSTGVGHTSRAQSEAAEEDASLTIGPEVARNQFVDHGGHNSHGGHDGH
jgi:hypothetical protein